MSAIAKLLFGSTDEDSQSQEIEAEQKQGWTFVAHIKQIPEGERHIVTVGNRTITLFHPRSRLPTPRAVPEYAKKLAQKFNSPEPSASQEVRTWRKEGNVVYALDEFCYHEGGPLSAGDIEDWNGIACVKCPYHAYAISLQNGERFLQDLSGGFKSLGIRQRAHEVKVSSQTGNVYLKLSLPEQYPNEDPRHKLECDRFQEGKFAKKAYAISDKMKGAQLSKSSQ